MWITFLMNLSQKAPHCHYYNPEDETKSNQINDVVLNFHKHVEDFIRGDLLRNQGWEFAEYGLREAGNMPSGPIPIVKFQIVQMYKN